MAMSLPYGLHGRGGRLQLAHMMGPVAPRPAKFESMSRSLRSAAMCKGVNGFGLQSKPRKAPRDSAEKRAMPKLVCRVAPVIAPKFIRLQHRPLRCSFRTTGDSERQTCLQAARAGRIAGQRSKGTYEQSPAGALEAPSCANRPDLRIRLRWPSQETHMRRKAHPTFQKL